ncbi:MAG: pectate lyase [Rikenellaceae bacterium]|jgi:PelA/Pel-15E family pectate lyase|nr:pectate lyase [Rikenellaceae bacterium]
MKKLITLLVVGTGACVAVQAQTYTPIDLRLFNDGIHHWYLEHPVRTYETLKPEQIDLIGNHLVAYQNQDGGWPKNIDFLAIIDIDSVKRVYHRPTSTFDNRNIYAQAVYLSEVYKQVPDEKYKQSVIRAIEYILREQRPSGGWRGWDVDAITYNDDVMTGLMELLTTVEQGESPFEWTDADLRRRAREARDRALDVTLRCQIVVDGAKTGWCQQHDHTTLEAIGARSFELASLSPPETADILDYLMTIKNPDRRVIEAVTAAAAWLERSKIYGMRVERVSIPPEEATNHEYPYDLVVVEDPAARPIWARFCEIGTNRPFMCNRDGIKVYKLSDVVPERRVGYSWYNYSPQKTLDRYAVWKQVVAAE